MRKFLTILFLLFPLIIKADEPRYTNLFTSKNKKYELKKEIFNKQEWSLIEKETQKILYKLEGNISSMTVFISDDGKSIVAIDDYSDQNEEKNPDVLLFFSNGKLIKSYKLYDLISNRRYITFTVSHFLWLCNFNKSDELFFIEDSKLKIQTNELNNYKFNLETGELIKKERDESLLGNSVYVYGNLKNLGNNKYEMQVKCVIYGEVPANKKIIFESVTYGWERVGLNESLVIKDGKLIEVKEIMFNACQ